MGGRRWRAAGAGGGHGRRAQTCCGRERRRGRAMAGKPKSLVSQFVWLTEKLINSHAKVERRVSYISILEGEPPFSNSNGPIQSETADFAPVLPPGELDETHAYSLHYMKM